MSLVDREVATVVDAVVQAVQRLNGPVSEVGIGVPGFVYRQRVVASPNFPTWADVPFARLVSEALGVPVTIENDANAATLGAWRERGAREDLVLLTLGTGVGGGVISDGRLLRGAIGTGGELGHIYAGGDAPCSCGNVGCLEQWCGTVGLVRLAAAKGQAVQGGLELVRAADRGEAWAIDVLEQAALALGRGLVTLVNVFNPDVVVIAGGLANARRWLAEPAEAWLVGHAIRPNAAHVQLVWEGRADRFAIQGAAEVARYGRTTV